MGIEMSATQRSRVDKIERLRRYFKEDSPLIYEWVLADAALDFASMSDDDVAKYLATSSA